MRLVLKDFQDEYVAQLLEEIRAARVDASRRPQAVTLSAPTGSGKTVMMAAAMERLIDGDDVAPPNPGVVFLWITDQPELNEQTRRRLLSYSTTFSPMHIEVIDTNFDRIALSPGRLYFLNTQKLGKDKTLVTPSDKRTYTIWETFSRTVQDRGADFIVIVDEAHRGMDLDPKAQGEALSIVQKFIVGSPGEIEAAPMIVGVTATPKRFNQLLEQTTRVADIIRVAFRQLGGEQDSPPVTPPWFLPGAEAVWQRIAETERALRAAVREVYVARFGDSAAARIEAAVPEGERQTLARNLARRPAGAEPLSLVDYLYLGQLTPILFAPDVQQEARNRFSGAQDPRQRLLAAVSQIVPVRNEIAHVREIAPDRLLRASVACVDVLDTLKGSQVRKGATNG